MTAHNLSKAGEFTPTPPIDQVLWDKLQGLGEASEAEEIAYEWLLPSADVIAREREVFIASEYSVVPDLRPHHIGKYERGQLVKWKESLFALKTTIPVGEDLDITDQERAVRQAYRWRINENIANLRMVEAADRRDIRRFERYNTFIYGEPDRNIYAAVADWYCHVADTVPSDASEELRLAAATITTDLGSDRGDRSMLVPDKKVFDTVREERNRSTGFVALITAGVDMPETGMIGESTGNALLVEMLKNMGSTQKLVASSSWANTPDAIKYPAHYNLTVPAFKSVVFHELLHAWERISGKKSGVMLSASGFDRYETGNEGRSVAQEEIVRETFEEFAEQPRWQVILRRHLAVSLAQGLHGKPMSFPENYRVINAIDSMYELMHPEPNDTTEAALSRAHDRTWNLLKEIYKGTDGKGIVNLRPMIYLQGNVAFWQKAKKDLERQNNDGSDVWIGDLGKFDPTNVRHIAILQALGKLPATTE